MTSPFRPPFGGLAALAWLYFVACYLLFPDSYVLRGAFVEVDDYTYLAQTVDWLNGQGWFDNVQHRLAPPDGTFIHYTRLAELPLAAFTLLFHQIHSLPWAGAATLAALVYPPLLLIGLFYAAGWVAESFMPRDWTRITVVTVMFSEALLFQFSLGHVGHRAPEAILVLLATGCIYRMLAAPEDVKWSIKAGFLLALSMALALEALPWVLILSAWVGVWFVAEGRRAARAALLFGGTQFVASAFFLAIYRTPQYWFVPEIMSYSVVYVILAACILVCYAGVAWAARTQKQLPRYAVGLLLPVFVGAAFLHFFPALIKGPYGAMDRDLAQVFFTVIPEARPFVDVVPLWVAAFSLGTCLLALGVSLVFLRRANPQERWLWALSVVLLAAAIALTAFYQMRFFRFANLFSVVPLAVLIERGCRTIDKCDFGRWRIAAKIGVVIVAGPLFSVLLPALIDARPFAQSVLMYPMRDVRNACDLYPVEGLLRSADYVGKKPLLIMNTMSTGPEILFRTRHSVMAAPYHYNVWGNEQAMDFFGAADAMQAESIAQHDKIDMVLICKSAIDIYHRDTPRTTPLFIEQLMQQQVPAWLKEINLPPSSNFLIFMVVR